MKYRIFNRCCWNQLGLLSLFIALASAVAQQPPKGAIANEEIWLAFLYHEDAVAKNLDETTRLQPKLAQILAKKHADELGITSNDFAKIAPIAASAHVNPLAFSAVDYQHAAASKAQIVSQAKTALQAAMTPKGWASLQISFSRVFYGGPRPR